MTYFDDFFNGLDRMRGFLRKLGYYKYLNKTDFYRGRHVEYYSIQFPPSTSLHTIKRIRTELDHEFPGHEIEIAHGWIYTYLKFHI